MLPMFPKREPKRGKTRKTRKKNGKKKKNAKGFTLGKIIYENWLFINVDFIYSVT